MLAAVSWIDAVFALLLAGMIAFGASRRLTGLWVGVGGVLLLRPLLGLAAASPLIGLAAAVGGGLVLGLVGRHLFVEARTGRAWQSALGALGGATLGTAMVLALAVSFPIQRSPFDPNQLYYPPRDLPPFVQGAVLRSWTMSVGRDVLLFPLLEAQGSLPQERETVLRGLHRLLVIGEPWRREGG